jgi:hypothetical protein
MRFEIEKIILEGPDLSGKTSLYNEIHKRSGYKWNVQDRSCLSMVCYARQFGREEKSLKRALEKELSNLNNRVVILLPLFDELKFRLESRGDDIQTLETLRSLYRIFEDESAKISKLPNVMVLRENLSLDDTSKKVISWLATSENHSAEIIGQKFVKGFVLGHDKSESVLTFECSGNISDYPNDSILENEHEGLYYREILHDFSSLIEKEIEGLNEYGKPQDMSSRRFYYSSKTCISSLHFKPRRETLNFICTLRSTDVVKNAAIDLSFLEFLVHKLGTKYFTECKDYFLTVTMNSAHLRNDVGSNHERSD